MGKHRKDSRSRSRSASPASDTEKKSRSKEKKRRKEHKHKHKHREASEERLLAEAKAFLRKKLTEERNVASSASDEEMRRKKIKKKATFQGSFPRLGEDDYFQRNGEFSTWLSDTKRIYFNDIDSEKAHELFGEFVEEWNAGQLPSKFYVGTAAATAQRTGYTWNFAGESAGRRLDRRELGMTAALDDKMELESAVRAEAAESRKQRRRRAAAEERDWISSVYPKAEGREARLEKKAALREERRARDQSPDTVRLPGGGDVFGGEGDSFAAAAARERAREERRARDKFGQREEVQQRLVTAQAAEDSKMAQFRALLDQTGGAISIPKRAPNVT